jgi:protein-S-isoprenylcysteine O-methyltransferase Ste14
MNILIYFAGVLFVLACAYVTFRIVVRRDYVQKGRLGGLAAFLETAIFAVHGMFSYSYLPAGWFAALISPERLWLKVIGLVLFIGGLMGTLIGMTGLGFGRVFGQEVNEVQKTGLYSKTRNPQIIAYGLVVLGWAVPWLSWRALGWVLLYGAIAHLMIITEEEHLRAVGGQAYARYCEEVPRYIRLF